MKYPCMYCYQCYQCAMYLGISFVIMLLSPYPPTSEVVLDSVGKGKVEIFPSRIMTISAQSVVQMPIESLLHIRHVLHRSNSANRDLLPALLTVFNHNIVSIVYVLNMLIHDPFG